LEISGCKGKDSIGKISNQVPMSSITRESI